MPFFALGEKKPRHSTVSMIKQIYRQNGFRGLFTGIVPRVVKVVPACAIMISTFEYGKVFFKRLAQSREDPQLLAVSNENPSVTNDTVSDIVINFHAICDLLRTNEQQTC